MSFINVQLCCALLLYQMHVLRIWSASVFHFADSTRVLQCEGQLCLKTLIERISVYTFHIDVQKTFEKVLHKRLLAKVEAYGSKGKLLVQKLDDWKNS